MDKNKELSANELLAAIAHADLKESEVVIKLADRWVCGSISEMDVHAQAGFIAEFEIKGYIKS